MEEGCAWDEGLSFCFWDVQSKCLTLDYQALESNEKSYQDLRYVCGKSAIRFCESFVILAFTWAFSSWDEWFQLQRLISLHSTHSDSYSLIVSTWVIS